MNIESSFKIAVINESREIEEIKEKSDILKKNNLLIELKALGIDTLNNEKKISFSGIIIEIGNDIYDYKINNNVYSFLNDLNLLNKNIKYIEIDSKFISLMPSNLNYLEAASLPYCFLITFYYIKAYRKKFNKILINGSDNLALFLIQSARMLAYKEIGIICTKEKIKLALELGVNTFFLKDKTLLKDDLKDWNLIFDLTGNINYENYLKNINKKATFLTIKNIEKSKKSFLDFFNKKNISMINFNPDQSELDILTSWVESWLYCPLVYNVFDNIDIIYNSNNQANNILIKLTSELMLYEKRNNFYIKI